MFIFWNVDIRLYVYVVHIFSVLEINLIEVEITRMVSDLLYMQIS